MQQTQNYKLNLIETSDPLSPAPLNENTSTLDAALTALTARIVTLENCRIMVGQYRGIGGNIYSEGTVIDLGERPAAVLVSFWANHFGYTQLVAGDMVANGTQKPELKIVDNGFWVRNIFNSDSNEGYSYIAFFGDWPVKNIDYPKTT